MVPRLAKQRPARSDAGWHMPESFSRMVESTDSQAQRRDDVEKEESERCSFARRLQARADPTWPEIDTGIICWSATLEADRPALPVMRGDY